MNTKDLIRSQVKEALEALTAEVYTQASQQIADHLIGSPYWREAGVIALTISRELEVDTYGIIRQAWAQGKRVAIPRADFSKKTLTFYEINHFAQLEKRAFGLKEPIPEKCPIVPVNEMDLVVVPGLAFDRFGGRLGYGGGFYDRFLPNVRAKTVALAFPCQLLPAVPTEEHDRKVDYIIEPRGFFR